MTATASPGVRAADARDGAQWETGTPQRGTPPPRVAGEERRHGLWSPLTTSAANLVLRQGGYGLRVERRGSRALHLLGSGAGTGIPLGHDPTWADLYRALVRLRRTRNRHDPRWLRRLTRLLDADGARRDRATTWNRVPADQVERLTAPNTPADEALRLPEPLVEDGHVLFPEGTPGDQHAPAAPDAAAPLRLTRCPDRSSAQRQLRGWSLLNSALDHDPLLRMHCAVQPAPAALVHHETGRAVLTRLGEPAPAHPGHPGGTVIASLAALVRPRPDGTPGLLRHVIESRFERREHELGYFVEHLVRPLLRSFRTALETHRLGLLSLDEHGVGFELSPELHATGRIVVTGYEQIRETAELTRADVRRGVEALVGTLEELINAFGRLDFPNGTIPEHRIRAAVDQVTGEELRYLQEHSAELLSCEHPLRRFTHTIASEQDAVLKEVLHAVQERTRARRWNAQLPQAAVVIDLDLCGIVPLRRTLEALASLSGPREGAPEGIPELADPESLPILPTYAGSTWPTFVDVSGLGAKYPQVDWQQLHEEFFRAFARPWTNLRTDVVNAGLARFVWDVQDAGGRVVFCTGRRERVRGYTEEVLANGGVPDAALLCMPDDRTRPISELKAELLRELDPDLDVVAVFDDMQENRSAIAREFRGAITVAVEVPGLVAERRPDQPAAESTLVISTFETSPRTGRRRSTATGLSYAHSLEELQIGALRTNRPARSWAIRLTERESLSIVESMLADTDRAAKRTARGAREKFGLALPPENGPDLADTEERTDGVIRALHHVFTRKQFFKGARANYQPSDMRRDVEPFVREQRPIDVVLLGFPVKQCLNRLKAVGPLPDFAELGGLARLRELQQAVREIYPPGLRFNILTDGRHFRSRPESITGAYSRKLREYADLVGIGAETVVEEIDAVATERIGPHLPTERARRISRYHQEFRRLMARFDITARPLRTLDSIREFASGVDGSWAPWVRLFPEMLMSVVYSVPLPVRPGVERLSWATAVYADLYGLDDRTATPEVRRARAEVLRRAWHTVLRYMVVMRVDEEFGYEELFPSRVRLTVSAARSGRCGFTYLGGSGLLPWQGTGVADPRGRLAIDFAISLFDQGFVPVYSPLLGPRQPWLMVPAQQIRLDGGTPRLDEEFAERIRLRRK